MAHYTPGVGWIGGHWLEVLGWGGSALLVHSLLQSRVLRLRWLNLAACVILAYYNARLEVWPMVAMNLVLCAINIWFIVQLTRQRHDPGAFTVLRVGLDDSYLAHVLEVNGPDIVTFHPDVDPGHVLADVSDAFLVQHGAETVGVVLLRRRGPTAYVVLDYVTPRFRDFSPGEFVWRQRALLREAGVHRVVTDPAMVAPYYGHVGFRREDDAYALDL